MIEGWSVVRRCERDFAATGRFQRVCLGDDRAESERMEAWLGEEIKASGAFVREDLFSEPAIFAMPELCISAEG